MDNAAYNMICYTTEIQDETRLDQKGGSLGIVQLIKIWPYWQMNKPEFHAENEIHKIIWDFEIQSKPEDQT